MSTELVTGHTSTPEMEQTALAVIARAASDPSVDVGKMQALMDMQLRIMEKNAEAEFNAAMARLQPKLPRIIKEGKAGQGQGKSGGYGYSYARYEDIDHAIRPMLNEEGFALSFDSVFGEKLCTIIGKLSHRGGHSTAASIPLPLDTSGGKNGIQGMGSTLSYGKRYCVGMLLNIVTVGEDDDATYGACQGIDTGGKTPGTKAAQEAVRDRKVAEATKAAKPATTTNFKALEHFKLMKKELGEAEYYAILKANGFQKSNEITDINVQRDVYRLMGARLNDIRLGITADDLPLSEDDMLRQQEAAERIARR